MATDNLTAVLYKVDDLRLVSYCTKSVELCSDHESSLHVTSVYSLVDIFPARGVQTCVTAVITRVCLLRTSITKHVI